MPTETGFERLPMPGFRRRNRAPGRGERSWLSARSSRSPEDGDGDRFIPAVILETLERLTLAPMPVTITANVGITSRAMEVRILLDPYVCEMAVAGRMP
ncbi:hypothetical protein QP185_21520 [Sphingomonas aerolata]|uniref:hypothetical protein n=1 Tax=Sphingomonas aerolata TaxID=185951 RepID=UPI002FE368EB